MTLSDQIIKIRKDSFSSQEQFAKSLGVNANIVNKWERGTVIPSEDDLKRIAMKFDQDYEFLYSLVKRNDPINKKVLASKTRIGLAFEFLGIVLFLILGIATTLQYVVYKPENEQFILLVIFSYIFTIVLLIMLIFGIVSKEPLIEYNSNGVFINKAAIEYIEFKDIINVEVENAHGKSTKLTFGTLSIVTKDIKYNIASVAGVEDVKNELLKILQQKKDNLSNID